jgi:hypothetical protein
MKVVVAAEAVLELRAARQWYDRRAPGLGARLVDRIDDTIAAIAREPMAFPKDRREPIA